MNMPWMRHLVLSCPAGKREVALISATGGPLELLQMSRPMWELTINSQVGELRMGHGMMHGALADPSQGACTADHIP